LCIPSAEEQRKNAIQLLRAIYRNTAKVLVLDKSIQQVSDDTEAENLLWTITSLSWMQRLWTYQESFSAKVVIFQLNDSTFALDQDFPSSMLPKPLQVVHTGLVQHLNNIRPAKDLEVTTQTNLGEVAAALNWRSTSKAGDETLAIAALFNVDTVQKAIRITCLSVPRFTFMLRTTIEA